MPEPQSVWIVDDEPTMLSICQAMLESYYEVKTFDSAHALLIHLDLNHQPDVIITDIVMPGIDGMDLIARLRALNVSSTLVIISGASEKSHAIEALRQGVFALIEKPFERREFEHAVHLAATQFLLEELRATLMKEYAHLSQSLAYYSNLQQIRIDRLERVLQALAPTLAGDARLHDALAELRNTEEADRIVARVEARIAEASKKEQRLLKLQNILKASREEDKGDLHKAG